jgi:hypothetical protein
MLHTSAETTAYQNPSRNAIKIRHHTYETQYLGYLRYIMSWKRPPGNIEGLHLYVIVI